MQGRGTPWPRAAPAPEASLGFRSRRGVRGHLASPSPQGRSEVVDGVKGSSLGRGSCHVQPGIQGALGGGAERRVLGEGQHHCVRLAGEDTRHGRAGEPWGPGPAPSSPPPSSHCLGPLRPTWEEGGPVPGPGPWRPEPPSQAWMREVGGRSGERGRHGLGRGVP